MGAPVPPFGARSYGMAAWPRLPGGWWAWSQWDHPRQLSESEMSMRLLHTMLRVGDLERSIAFYTELLGMRLLRRRENAEHRYTLAFVGYGDERDQTVRRPSSSERTGEDRCAGVSRRGPNTRILDAFSSLAESPLDRVLRAGRTAATLGCARGRSLSRSE